MEELFGCSLCTFMWSGANAYADGDENAISYNLCDMCMTNPEIQGGENGWSQATTFRPQPGSRQSVLSSFPCCQVFPPPEMSTEETTATSSEVRYRSTDGDRPKQFKHWVRPRSSLYSYLYDFSRNYYDDILDYLDRRRRGLPRDIPRPQTWAERALRTYTQKLGTPEHVIKARNDADLIHRVHRSRIIHDYHSKDYNARRFTMAVF